MVDPLFWLGLSLLLVAVSLTATLVAALPALRELSRAARSAEKLFDTLSRELPPTLEAIRLTGLEISDLTDDVSEGVQSAGRVVKQVDQSVSGARQQAKQVQIRTRSVWAGAKAAWRSFTKPTADRRKIDRLPANSRPPVPFTDDYPYYRPTPRRSNLSEPSSSEKLIQESEGIYESGPHDGLDQRQQQSSKNASDATSSARSEASPASNWPGATDLDA